MHRLATLLCATLAVAAHASKADDVTVRQAVECLVQSQHGAARAACARHHLAIARATLTDEHAALQRHLPPEGRALLSQSDAEWRRRRDTQCRLQANERDTQRWLAHVAASPARTDCVLAQLNERSARLAGLAAGWARSGSQAIVLPREQRSAAISGTVTSDDRAARLASSREQHRGQRYFEVVIDEARLESEEGVLQVRLSDGRGWVGGAYELRKRDLLLQFDASTSVRIVGGNLGEVRVPQRVIGFAADLGTGRLYRRDRGLWSGLARPGSQHATTLPAGRPLRAEVVGSAPLEPWLASGALAVNFGDGSKPFAETPPRGYIGFDDAAEPASEARNVTDQAPPPQPRPAERAAIVRSFWRWVAQFPSEASPSTDNDGSRCALHQQGDTWFLAGNAMGGAVQRACTVPRGKRLLVPLLAARVQGREADTCTELRLSLLPMLAGVDDLHVQLDGEPLFTRGVPPAHTDCVALPVEGEGARLHGVGGYWVVLPPLAPGRHRLTYGARAPALELHQAVAYDFLVE